MIINNFNMVDFAVLPAKTYAPLFVDSDAVLPFSVTSKFFQTISRRNAHILQPFHRFKLLELSLGLTLQLPGKPSDHPSVSGQGLGIPTGEIDDHKLLGNTSKKPGQDTRFLLLTPPAGQKPPDTPGCLWVP